jgi:hypothetical protein
VVAASWQDRDGAKTALLGAYLATPIRRVFADQGFTGRLIDGARDMLKTTVEIVRELADQRRFGVHPRRWVVERTLAWLTACRRLARDDTRAAAPATRLPSTHPGGEGAPAKPAGAGRPRTRARGSPRDPASRSPAGEKRQLTSRTQ